MDDVDLSARLDAIDAALLTIHEALTAIHVWQAERPSARDIADRLEEVLHTYGLTAQLVEVWRQQLTELQAMHRTMSRLTAQIELLAHLAQSRAVGDEERG